ncbi:hypothetical protein MMC18_002899 [Xylographa bjoerkii]|nr:hypothetical protein [Xylographa bjoerkii]
MTSSQEGDYVCVDRERDSKSEPKLEKSNNSGTTHVRQTPASEGHRPYYLQPGLRTNSGSHGQASGQALTYGKLVEHNHHQAQVQAAPGSRLQCQAGHIAAVTSAGRSLGFDLSQPIYQKNLRGYEAMTPLERFLAEKDRAERAKLAWEASGGCRRQYVDGHTRSLKRII